MGVNITSNKVRVYRKDTGDHTRYSIGIGKKLQNGEYDNAYIEIIPPKDIVFENKTDIVIKDGFITFDTYENSKNGKTYKTPIWKFKITDFELADGSKIVDVPDNGEADLLFT